VVSPARRDYLADIYRIRADDQRVTTSTLADRKGVSPSAVVRMVDRLEAAGLVHRVPYSGIELTPTGEREALRGIRRHRLLEVFLVQVLHFGWEQVHDEVEGLQHAISDTLEDRIDEMLDHPQRCPHGDPIPTRDGVMPVIRDVSLPEVTSGTNVTISRVRTHDPDKLRYLATLGLVPGARCLLVNRAPFNGPLRLQLGSQEHVLGAELAAMVWVERE
jgi:DtxR family Mn-dependent transcriptional regulator